MSEPGYSAVLALIGGASTAALIGLLGAWIQSRREHGKWLRERRLEAYRAFMIDMDTYKRLRSQTATLTTARKLKRQHENFAAVFPGSFEAVSLLGPRSVNAAGQRWIEVFDAPSTPGPPFDRAAYAESRWAFLVAAGRVLSSENVAEHMPSRGVRHGTRSQTQSGSV